MNTPRGVAKLLRDRHHIAVRRDKGDYAACDILLDLDKAIWKAHLTDRQALAIALVYGLDVTQETAAEAIGVTQQAVEQFVNGACKRIARVYQRWNYGEVTVTFTEGDAPDDTTDTAA